MIQPQSLATQPSSTIARRFAASSISLLVGVHGLFILVTSLLDQLQVHHNFHHISNLVIDLPLLVGLSLLYISGLLRRRKYTAWLVTICAYIFYLGLSILPLLNDIATDGASLIHVVRSVILPITVLSLLVVFRNDFVVRSDQRGFRSAFKFSALILIAALLYGLIGFTLLDKTDFHQEIGFSGAVHYTIDQFDLTTNKPIRPYTRRAHIFTDSLSFVSTAAVLYAVVSFFQPLRLRLSDQAANRQRMRELLVAHGAPSEDYFKLWPHDKQYFFDPTGRSGLAFHVWRGVAICLGDPAGEPQKYAGLLDSFGEQCFQNDWLPAFVHVEDSHRRLYEGRGYSLQKLGQEAVVALDYFQASVVTNKYFRHIRNKFTKQGFTAELLLPPHHPAVISRLDDLSRDWLSRGGRAERGFAMGYFTDEYLQACPIMTVRDAAGTIQAFTNQIPAEFDVVEATYDLMRHSLSSPGNINDFLMINFITCLREQGYQRLNMGLCPLTGLSDADDENNGLIHALLRFAYANGDRFYSFSGLYRFKSKYEPEWRDRFVAYRGGLRGFSRTMTALMRTMRVK